MSSAEWRNLTVLDLGTITIYIGLNEVGDGGCKHLGGADWKNLRKLNLCRLIVTIDSNKIGDEGCVYLSRAEWKNLAELTLCILTFIELQIKLALTDANT